MITGFHHEGDEDNEGIIGMIYMRGGFIMQEQRIGVPTTSITKGSFILHPFLRYF